jgi:tetratricopeptide (TPR) repeat protein
VAAFFEEPWSRLSPNLSAPAQAWLLNEAASRLRFLGRLTEAVEPMRLGMERMVETEDWKNAATSAGNLSGMEVNLGRLGEAVTDGRRAVEFADRSEDAFQKVARRTDVADALYRAGKRAEADALFAQAERMQAEKQPEHPLLYSRRGFRYADLLLAPAERAAWQKVLVSVHGPRSDDVIAGCGEAERRAEEARRAWREIFTNRPSLLDISLDELTLARARLYRALLSAPSAFELSDLETRIHQALTKLRESNSLDHLPEALLTAALYAGAVAGRPDEAREWLDEARLIAERGPMPLYLADVHLHRARLFGRLEAGGRRLEYPWTSPREDLHIARELIEKHGYWRRREELADAEAALE